jgi:hypothetical protein
LDAIEGRHNPLILSGVNGLIGLDIGVPFTVPVRRMIGVQPCDFASSPVSSYFRVFSQPTTPLWGPPALVHRVLSKSFAKYRCCVVKQVSISDHLPLFGSYIES